MRRFLSGLGLILLLLATLSGTWDVAVAAPGRADPLPKSRLIAELKLWAEETEADPKIEALEKDLAKEFLYRLRFQIERRYDGTDASFVRILSFMQELEQSPQNRSLSQVNEFLSELIRCIHMNREPAESLFGFVKAYTRQSGLQSPTKAEDYAQGRAYLNGRESLGAKSLTDEDWIRLGTLFDEAHAEVEEAHAEVEEAPVTEEVSSGSETLPAPNPPTRGQSQSP